MSQMVYGSIVAASAEALFEALEARDPYTAGHGLRVAILGKTIGEEIGLPQGQVMDLYWASRLHDVGKIGVPDQILLKAGSLNEAETAMMRQHTRIGRRILTRIEGFGPLLAVAELHHENFDGSGYPFGLRGEDIPLVARIVRLADAYDAMTTNRVYRRALDPTVAIDQIAAGSGTLFDPQVVAAFLASLRSGSFDESFQALSRVHQEPKEATATLDITLA